MIIMALHIVQKPIFPGGRRTPRSPSSSHREVERRQVQQRVGPEEREVAVRHGDWEPWV